AFGEPLNRIFHTHSDSLLLTPRPQPAKSVGVNERFCSGVQHPGAVGNSCAGAERKNERGLARSQESTLRTNRRTSRSISPERQATEPCSQTKSHHTKRDLDETEVTVGLEHEARCQCEEQGVCDYQ